MREEKAEMSAADASVALKIDDFRKACSRGDFGAALDIANWTLQERPASSELWTLCSEVLLINGRRDQALEALKLAHELGPESAVLIAAEAYIAAFEARFDEGKAAAERALMLDSTDAWVLNRCVSAAFIAGDTAKAVDLCEHWRTLHPEAEQAILVNAILLLSAGRTSEVEALLAESEVSQPSSPVVWNIKAKLLMRQGQMLEAIELTHRALEVLPRNPDILGQLAQMLELATRHDEAEAMAKKALELSPISTTALSTLANVCRATGRKREAAHWEAEAAVAVPALRARMKLRQAVAAIRDADWAKCLRITDEILADSSVSMCSSVLQIRIRALLALDKLDEAAKAIVEMEQAGCNDTILCEFRAILAEKHGDRDTAVSLLRNAITECPTAGQLRAILIRNLHALGRTEDELELIRDTLQNPPQAVSGFAALVSEFMKAGHSDAAREIRSIGLTLFPDSEQLRLFEAVDELSRGNLDNASQIAGRLNGDMRNAATHLEKAIASAYRLRDLSARIRSKLSKRKPPTMN